jgi:hypothetical protein
MELVKQGNTLSKGGGPITGDERHTHFHSPADIDKALLEAHDQPLLRTFVRLAAPRRLPLPRPACCAIAGGRCDSGACSWSAS